jgi:hypothetical protein
VSIFNVSGLRSRDGRSLNRRAAIAAMTGIAALGAGGAYVATAAVPSFPNNIVVFPDRDFVTIEGYQDHIGQTALLEVTRNGQVVGSAKGVVQEGDVAFEVNHPGGYCWGNETALSVTPDIRAGDKVSLSFDGVNAGDTTVQDSSVTQHATLSGSTVTVIGRIASSVNGAQMEQRIINPDLVDTEVGRRDIRAVPGTGGLVPAPKGGYSSELVVDNTNHTFKATYVFNDAATAAIAAKSGGERAMAWEQEDADGNRQGLTIAEFGEAGGPGMGGCPTGPADQAAPKPGNAWADRTGPSEITVKWAPVTAAPDTTPVTGYAVSAIAKSEATGQRAEIGRRTAADVSNTVITGLSSTETYDVEVRAIAGGKMSESFPLSALAPAEKGDTTAPVLTATPLTTKNAQGQFVANSVTLSSELNADIYYTVDGKPALISGGPGKTAQRYTGPIPISGTTEVNAVAFDRAGNTDTFTGTFVPGADASPKPTAPQAPTGTAAPNSVALQWAAGEAGVTGYTVRVYTEGGTTPVQTKAAITGTSTTISGLAASTAYEFTVTAKNSAGESPESPRLTVTTTKAPVDTLTQITARFRAGDSFRVTGNTTMTSGTILVRTGSVTGPIIMTAPITAALAPATGGTFDARLRGTDVPAAQPASVWVESSNGGTAGPITVTRYIDIAPAAPRGARRDRDGPLGRRGVQFAWIRPGCLLP